MKLRHLMTVKDLQSGIAFYVDPLAVQAVVPAFAGPPAGVPAAQAIPKQVGSQLFIMGCAPLVVRGFPAELAEEVDAAKAVARTMFPALTN